jgi:hypothetical protein
MIKTIQPLAVGNALRVFVDSPAQTLYWRLLRKTADTFTGPTDVGAQLVAQSTDTSVLDTESLVNGTTYWYRAYYWNGTAWLTSASVSAIPNATYADASTDVVDVLVKRLAAGLAVEVTRGVLSHKQGAIPVLSAPPIVDQVKWPLISVHLQSEQPQDRSLGEAGIGEALDPTTGEFLGEEGWLAGVQCTIIAWSLNPDERVLLRKCLRRLIVANLPVFEANGMVRVDFSMADMEDLEANNAPLYQVMCTFSCEAPVRVTQSSGDVIVDVTQTFTVT